MGRRVTAGALVRVCYLVLGLAALGCSKPTPSPFFGDDKYLRFGVDPEREASAVIEDQKQRGYVLALRLAGRHFTALGFMDPSGRSSLVRIVTARGIAIALDPRAATPLQTPTTYALLDRPIPDTDDADRDGFDEVFVEQRHEGANCIAVYRVRDVGFVDPVLIDTRAFGQEFCATTVVDLDDDGSAELLGEIVLRGFEPAEPRVRVPLWARDHRFEVRGDPPGLATFIRSERSERQLALVDARKRGDTAQAIRLGIEFAALAHLEDRSPELQVGELDRALLGFALGPEQAAAILAARQRMFDDWNPEPTSPSAGTADKERGRAEQAAPRNAI